ncbi:hypothetical protein TNCV_3007331 [Trichonephila clavipes]|nr:hypothetical protein TNCV_3007331 [Trichonephila clavipes]
MQTYKLDPCWYFTTPALSWDAMLLHTKVAIELFTDYDMLLFIENGVRGAVEKKQFNSPPQLENQSQCRRKTTQLVSRNETTQQEKTTQLGSRNETAQLCTAVDRLHRLYSRIGFFYLLTLNLSRAEMSSRWRGVVVRRGGASSSVALVI